MATGDLPRFGELMRRHRTAAALSQEALAERAGVSARAISDLERGVHRAPRLESVRLLADALSLQADDRAILLAAARPDPEPESAALVSPQWPIPLGLLPIPPTRLIGREAEFATLTGLLADGDVRLVTLTGPGGTGKTHLAVAVAAAMRDCYPDGIWFVDLSALTDPLLVMPTIAATLGVQERVGQALGQTLAGFLNTKQLLLILDNCEQVLASASAIAALLATTPGVSIVATSRELLHIRAERVFAVAPLAVCHHGPLPALADVAHVPAIALFIDRATAATGDFALTEETAAAVAAICQHLDGLPLAIELAAARVKHLSPAALLARMTKRLPLLTSGARDSPARQRTMRDTIAWSYDLLSSAEQALFRRLAVCAGVFTLAAAEAVAAPEEALPVFDGIASLIEQSLLRRAPGPDDEPRYVMLETVREFGLEMLMATGETESSRERHAWHFLGPDDVQMPFAPLLDAPESPALLAAERDNVRLAIMWLDERDELDALLSRTLLLYRLWFAPGLHHEGQQWIDRALERASRVAPLVRFRALDAALTLAQHGGDHPRAAEFVAEALALARELDDPLLIGEALTNAGILAYRQGEYDRAEGLLLEADGLLREHTERATYGITLLILGDTAMAQEQFDRAAAWYAEALELFETTNYPWGLSDTQAGLGGIRLCTGHLGQAAALYGDSLAQAQEWGFTMLVISSLLGLAAVSAAVGRPETGARLLGAAEGAAASLGSPIYPRDKPIRDRALNALAELGSERIAAAREAGRVLTLERASAEAAAVVQHVTRSSP